MSLISLIPQNFGTLYDTIPDIQGFAVTLHTTDPLTMNLKNQLEGSKAISGFLVMKKLGLGDVYINIISAEDFQLIRSANVEMLIGVF